ncbi:WD40-repeat-containing domain protein [Crepidotus variabilis]|uniref:WD40-repeat-containing domain protein n=1 Tax=Crepidotus variabilis TaxID=179855 RepID=A0A9P6EVH3_9AGAR|nr:WD40-repeat-containing domain protein [Crepidotus variabilis]
MAASTSKHSNVAAEPLKTSRKSASKKGKGKENNTEPDVTSIPLTPLDDDPWEQATPWNWTSLTDPSSSRIPPVFTKDGSYFFSLVGSSVKIHSTFTGLVVSTLTSPPSVENTAGLDVITSAVLNPQNPFQLITGALDGRILIWDFVNANLLQTITLGQPIHLLCAHENFKGYVFVAASKARKTAGTIDNNAVVLQVALKQSDSSGKPAEIMPVGKTRSPSGLAVSSNGAWLVATAGHKVYIAKTALLSAGFTKYVSAERLTCLGFHPLEEYFATGDEKGIVRLWYCLNDELAVNIKGVEKRTQTRALHWHAHPVSSVSFTSNGAYLLSGGEEAVLVIWQLHTGRKEFIPRLGAPIGTVSVAKSLKTGEEEYLLGLMDATYAFVSSTSLKITRSYSRIKVDPSLPFDAGATYKPFSVPIAVHPLTATLVLPSSHPSSLQIYSPASSTLLSELEVSPSNRVSRRDDKPITPSRVEKVVISISGAWMATVDAREGDVGFRREVYIKFWSWDSKENNWTLNSRIDRPHGTDKVTDISFSPTSQSGTAAMLVSTGEDGKIKVWSPRLLPGTESAVIWTSHATLNFRQDIPGSVSWAPDSSLFAVAVGPHIALYDPFTKMLRRTLTVPDCQKIQFVHFIGRQGRHLLATSLKNFIMWDLIDGCVSWQRSQTSHVSAVVPHPRSSTFAVFHSVKIAQNEPQTKVLMFDAASNLPTSLHSLPFHLRHVIYTSFETSAGFSIVGITHAWRVVIFGDSPRAMINISPKGLNFGRHPPNRTLFQDIFGASAFLEQLPSAQEVPLRSKQDVSQTLFDGPVFLAPSLDTFFRPLLSTILSVRVEDHATQTTTSDPLDDDIVMVDEADNGLVILEAQGARSSYPGEMEVLTKLFRSSCKAKGTSIASIANNPKVNGKAHSPTRETLNGAHYIHSTAHHPSPKVLPSRNRIDDSQKALSPIIGGKKRKQLSS